MALKLIFENLDSVSATGSIGSVQVDITEKITGVQGVGQVNPIVLNATQDVTGVSATGAINTVGVGNSARPTGVQATGIVNTLVEDVSEALASVQGTTAIGSPTTTGVVTAFVAANYSRQRTLKIIPARLPHKEEGCVMALKWPDKDPDEQLDYSIDWSNALGDRTLFLPLRGK